MRKYISSLTFCVLAFSGNLFAETLYTIQDFGTLLCSEKSEAHSLNNRSCVVGKYYNKDMVSDFIWTPDDGFKVLKETTEETIYPKINNTGSVVGYAYQPSGWISSAKLNRYGYVPKKGIYIDKEISCGNGYSIFINDNFVLTANHSDTTKSTKSYLSSSSRMFDAKEMKDFGDYFPVAVNHKWQVLLTGSKSGLMGTNMFSKYFLGIYDVISGEITQVSEGKPIIGVGLNNEGMIIAKDKDETEGFYGNAEDGLKSMGKFIPQAINSHGDIVGKRDCWVYLRRADGSTIDLNVSTDLKGMSVTSISDVFDINDRGEILVTGNISGKVHAFLLVPVTS